MSEVRLIDANALKEEVNKKNVVGRFNMLLLIDNAPTVEPTFGLFKEMLCAECEKRPQGHWVRDINPYSKAYQLKCSVCGKWGGLTEKGYNHEFNYCPNCGADMKGGAE